MKYLKITKAILKSNWQNEIAYFADTWAGIMSTVTFSIAFIFAVKLLLSGSKSVGIYSSNDMLFLIFLSQIQLYLFSSPVFESLAEMHQGIRNGLLDSVLSKPLNLVAYLALRKLSFMKIIRSAPSLLTYILVIKWTSLGVTSASLFKASFIFALFLIADYALIFAISTKSILVDTPDNVVYSFFYRFHGAGFNLPMSSYSKTAQVLSTGLAPGLAMVFVSGAVALGRVSFTTALSLAVISNLIILPTSYMLWGLAMRKYSSASS